MILYFKEKSKKACLKWGIFTLIYFVCLYIIFVWQIQLQASTTIQIISTNSAIFEKNIKTELLNNEIIPKGDYLYISSSKGKYYYPKDCGKARVLSAKNMLFYKDKMDAEKAGYLPYLGCF